MPHVDIKCFSGRTEEQKRKCANQIAAVIIGVIIPLVIKLIF